MGFSDDTGRFGVSFRQDLLRLPVRLGDLLARHLLSRKEGIREQGRLIAKRLEPVDFAFQHADLVILGCYLMGRRTQQFVNLEGVVTAPYAPQLW